MIPMGNKGEANYLCRERFVPYHEIHAGIDGGVVSWNIAHGYGPADAWSVTAAGHYADGATIEVSDRRMFTCRSSSFQTKSHT